MRQSNRVAVDVEDAREKIWQRLSGPAIGNVEDVEARLRLERLVDQMAVGPDPRRSPIELSLVFFGVRYKLRDGVRRHRRVHGEEKCSLDELRDRHEVLGRV